MGPPLRCIRARCVGRRPDLVATASSGKGERTKRSSRHVCSCAGIMSACDIWRVCWTDSLARRALARGGLHRPFGLTTHAAFVNIYAARFSFHSLSSEGTRTFALREPAECRSATRTECLSAIALRQANVFTGCLGRRTDAGCLCRGLRRLHPHRRTSRLPCRGTEQQHRTAR